MPHFPAPDGLSDHRELIVLDLRGTGGSALRALPNYPWLDDAEAFKRTARTFLDGV